MKIRISKMNKMMKEKIFDFEFADFWIDSRIEIYRLTFGKIAHLQIRLRLRASVEDMRLQLACCVPWI